MIRFFDLFFSVIGTILFMPFVFIISLFILIESGFPIFYKQVRVGKDGRNFELYKFRSMYKDSDKKGLITIGGRDPRVTKVGLFIRKFKLDELPQLINVFLGHMSLVGPRPEVEKYVNLYTSDQKEILRIRPGITDYASIKFSDENDILVAQDNPEDYYINVLIPEKIRLNMIYVSNYSIKNYFLIIYKTFVKIIFK